MEEVCNYFFFSQKVLNKNNYYKKYRFKTIIFDILNMLKGEDNNDTT